MGLLSSGQFFDLKDMKGQEDEENCRMWSFILCALRGCWCNEIKEAKMSRTRSTFGVDEKCIYDFNRQT
jgi:hypothetical protein